MRNAHLRFGSLTFMKVTEKTTTHFKLRLDRFIGEVLPDPPRQAKAHFISVIGGDTQISAVSAAISMGDKFMIEGPGVSPIRVCLERNAQCYKGALQLNGRKKPVRHLVGISEEFGSTNTSGSPGRTILVDSSPAFVWTSLAHVHGLPGMPDWSAWFHKQLQRHQGLAPLLGIGCDPILVRGNKQRFLSWLTAGVESGELPFPETSGPIRWPGLDLNEIFQRLAN